MISTANRKPTQSMNKLITFPNGSCYVPSNRELVNSLFAPINGQTASGMFKVLPNGIRFHKANGEPFLFLVANKHSERFFVSCSRQLDGQIRYNYSTSSIDEKTLGLPESSLACCNLASSIWLSITNQGIS